MKLGMHIAILGAIMVMSPAHAAPKSVVGLWEQADGQGNVGAWFYFSEHDGVYEGRLVKFFPRPGDPVVDVCANCPGEQKNARMLGLTIVKGMKRNGLEYTEGSIMDPRDGSIYHAQMKMSADGKKLDVRGYIGIPMLGQTQTWTRLPDDAIPASAMPKEVLAGQSEKP